MKKTYIIPQNKWAELDETEMIAGAGSIGLYDGASIGNKRAAMFDGDDDDDDNFFVIEQTNVWDDEW